MTRPIPAAAPHPLVDGGGEGWLLWESRADVRHLSPAAVNLLVRARASDATPILVTDGVVGLTPAFAETWRQGGGAWVVRGSGGLREGFSGRRLDAVEDVLTAGPVREADDIDLAFLAPQPATALELTVVTSLRHRPTRAVLLGGAAEGIAEAAGRQIAAWGAHEPAVTHWDRSVLTEYARTRMPQETYLVAGGEGIVASLTARRTSAGIEEITTASVDLGTPTTLDFDALLGRVDEHLRSLGAGMPLVGFVSVRPVSRALRVDPRLPSPPTPLRLLIGPPGVKALGLRPSAFADRFGAELICRPRLPGLLIPLGTLGDPTWVRLDEILASIDRRLLDDALGSHPQWRRAPEGGRDGIQP